VFGTWLTPLHLRVAVVAEILRGPSEQSSTCLFQYFFRIQVHFLLTFDVRHDLQSTPAYVKVLNTFPFREITERALTGGHRRNK